MPFTVPPDILFSLRDYFKIESPKKIYTQIFILRGDIKLINLNRRNNETIDLKLRLSKDDFLVYTLNFFAYKDKKETALFLVNRELAVLCFNGTGEIWKYLLNILSMYFYYILIKSFLSSKELQELAKFINNIARKEVYYSKFIAKKILGEEFTDIFWKKKRGNPASFEEAFKRAEAREGLIDSIILYTEDELINLNMKRNLQFIFYQADLELITKLLDETSNFLIKRNKFYSGRSLKEIPDHTLKPIKMSFKQSIIEDKKILNQLIEIIKEYPDSSYTLVGSGNPYIYFTILDHKDKSSFSIQSYSDNSLILFPKIKTSSASLQRFCGYIINKFTEGEYNEF